MLIVSQVKLNYIRTANPILQCIEISHMLFCLQFITYTFNVGNFCYSTLVIFSTSTPKEDHLNVYEDKYLREKVNHIIAMQKEGKIMIAVFKDGRGLPAGEDLGQERIWAANPYDYPGKLDRLNYTHPAQCRDCTMSARTQSPITDKPFRMPGQTLIRQVDNTAILP